MAAALVAELTKLVTEMKTILSTIKESAETVKPAKAAKKVKSESAEPKAPRDATPTFMARNAYGKVLRLRHAERYAEDKAAGTKHLTTQKNLIDEDKPAFEKFTSAFVSAVESSGIPASRWKKDDEEFVEWESEFIKTFMAPASASVPSKKAPAPAPAPAPAQKPSSPVSAAVSASAAPPKKVLAKKAVKTVAKPTVTDTSLVRLTIDGDDYLRDTKTNGLWRLDEEGVQGAFTGYYQAGKEEPIRYCDSPEDE